MHKIFLAGLTVLLSSTFSTAAEQSAAAKALFDTYRKVCPAALEMAADVIDQLTKDGWENPNYKVDVPMGRNATLSNPDGRGSVTIKHLPFATGVYTDCTVAAQGAITMDDINIFKSEFPTVESIVTEYGDGTYDMSWLLKDQTTFTMVQIGNRISWASISLHRTSYSGPGK